MRPRTLSAIALLFLSLLNTPVHAHLLKIFATAQGDRIQGSVYFAGGTPAPLAQIELSTTDGHPLAQLQAGKDGEFSYQVGASTGVLLTAETGEGHFAKWTIEPSELTGPTTDHNKHPDKVEQHSANQAVPNNDIELAIARQITPLRKQLVSLEEHIRFQDILGGLGYILGLAGFAAWHYSRKKEGSK